MRYQQRNVRVVNVIKGLLSKRFIGLHFASVT